MKKAIITGFLALIVSIAGSNSWAQELDHSNFRETEQCYGCHGDDVNKEKYEASKHGKMTCVSCHDFTDQGQIEISEKCGRCHSDAAEDYNQSVHKDHENGPDCSGCHGGHYIFRAEGESCGICHSQVEESYKETFHGKAVALGSKQNPDCTYCHGSHLTLSSNNPESLTHPSNKKELCAKCHAGNTLGSSGVEHYTLEPDGFGAPMYWVKKVFMWLILLVVGFFLIHILLDLIYKLRSRKSRP